MNLFEFSFGFSDGTIFFSFSTSHQVEKEIKTKFEKKICNKEKNSFLFFWWKLILIVVHWLIMHVTYLNICIVSTYHELGTSGCTASASSRWSTHFWYSALITFVLIVVLSCVVIYYVLWFVSLWYDVMWYDEMYLAVKHDMRMEGINGNLQIGEKSLKIMKKRGRERGTIKQTTILCAWGEETLTCRKTV